MTRSTTQPSRAADEIAAYVAERLGQPWSPTGLHCWGLAQQTISELFGYDLPVVCAAPRCRRTKAALINGHDEMARWKEVCDPPFWAVALMHRRGSPADLLEHVGVYLKLDGGAVFHTDEPHGVVLDSIWELPRIRTWAAPRLFIPQA
jgi:hypothetical protein